MGMQARMVAARLAARRMPAGIGIGPRSGYTEAALVNNELAEAEALRARARPPGPGRHRRTGAQALLPDVAALGRAVPQAVGARVRPAGGGRGLADAPRGRARRATRGPARWSWSGDPKQLPPTDFFDRYDPLADGDDPLADEQVDAESILDLCRQTFRPVRRLRWHYRSRHESLIAFANKEHYADRPLITFPAAERASAFLGLELVPTPGRYEGRVNEPEARAVVAAAAEVARRRPELSLAIVAVNQPQRELIEELLAAEEAAEPALAAYRERWEHGLEPLIVKNLENIQGDERDVVLVSLVYGPNAAGKVHQRFGPIAGRHGHRRLNVLFTRARRKLAVFSSLRPDDILVGPDSKPGVRILRDYLRYAATGQLHAGEPRQDGYDSDFEGWVGSALRRRGPRSGASGGRGRVPDRPRACATRPSRGATCSALSATAPPTTARRACGTATGSGRRSWSRSAGRSTASGPRTGSVTRRASCGGS